MGTAFAVGRCVVLRAVAFGEMRWRGKAAGKRHVDHAHVRLHQQVARFLQAQFHVIAFRAAVQIPPEQAFELPGRHAHILRQDRRADRLFDVLFHDLDHLA